MSQLANIHMENAGQGPNVVILHGLFGDADNFRSIALHMQRHYNVTRLDLPGHGRSSSLDTLSINAMAEAICEALLNNGVNECYLLGHSLGGKVAMAIAGNDLNVHVNKLIVADIAPRVYPPHHQAILSALSSLPIDQLKSRTDADKLLSKSIPEAGVRSFLLKNLVRDGDANYQWRIDLAKLVRDYPLIRQIPSLSKMITCPTLFIKGGTSDYIEASDEPAIRKLFADPHFKEIAGTGHWLHAEKPAVFTKICSEFLLTA
jgi:esterase